MGTHTRSAAIPGRIEARSGWMRPRRALAQHHEHAGIAFVGDEDDRACIRGRRLMADDRAALVELHLARAKSAVRDHHAIGDAAIDEDRADRAIVGTLTPAQHRSRGEPIHELDGARGGVELAAADDQ
jgi:hypothetical protein